MIRNRYKQLHNLRRQRHQLHPQEQPQIGVVAAPPIVWESDYYHFKEQLSKLLKRNEEIRYFLNQYQMNPSVFNLQQLDTQIKITCKKIDQIDRWLNSFPFTSNNYMQLQLEKNIVKHFRQRVFMEINKVFAFRQQITEISNIADQREKSSFNAFNRSSNLSYSQLNNVGTSERNESMREVSKKIENLNEILRRMGDAVSFQGDIINRIDQNLNIAHTNVRGGKDYLLKRVQRQQGDQESEQFSCQGKANKVITSLYLIDIILILILVIKNL